MARDINSYRFKKPKKSTLRGMIARANTRVSIAVAEAAKAAELDAKRKADSKRKENKRDAYVGFVARGYEVSV